MSNTIWVSRNNRREWDEIWSSKPDSINGNFVGNVDANDTSYVGNTGYNDFFGVQPGECRRFQVIPDDDWIPVDDERKPKLGQRIWVTAVGNKRHVYRTVYDGEFGKLTVAWKPRHPRVEPEPYKNETNVSAPNTDSNLVELHQIDNPFEQLRADIAADIAELQKQVTASERFRREDSYDAERRLVKLREENKQLKQERDWYKNGLVVPEHWPTPDNSPQ